jgi:hypothetical protein
MKVDLFPTDALLRALDEPGSLIDDLDRAGTKAAAAFDAERGPTAHRLRAFSDVLVGDAFVPRSTRKRLVKAMPMWWEAITERARDGGLASMVAELEAVGLLADDPSKVESALHPVLAYVNEIGIEAAARAFEAYRAALPPEALAPFPGTLLATEAFEAATRAGNARFLSSLGARAGGDLFAFFRRDAPPGVFWTTIVVAAAGALGGLIVGPKMLTDAAGSVGLSIPPISADVDVGRFGERMKVRFGGTVRVVPGGLTDGPIWQQALDSAFGGGLRIGFRFDETFDLTAGVEWAPENREWGVKLTFTLLRF